MKVKVKHHSNGAAYQCGSHSLPAESDEFYSFTLFVDGQKVGEVIACKTKWGFWETHSDIYNSYHRGRGYGIYLYGYALNWMHRYGYEVRSSTTPSNAAIRLWNSTRLAQKFNVRYTGTRYKVLDVNKKPLKRVVFG